jgi:hypothetical protein
MYFQEPFFHFIIRNCLPPGEELFSPIANPADPSELSSRSWKAS